MTEQDAKDLANGKCDRFMRDVQSSQNARNRLIDNLTDSLRNLRDSSAGFVRDCDTMRLDAAVRQIIDAQRELMEHVREHNAHADTAERSRISTRMISIALA